MKTKILIYGSIVLAAVFLIYLIMIIFFPEPKDLLTVLHIRTFLELISFASTPLLLIAAAIGLRQLYYTKKEIEVTRDIFRKQSRRDSYEAAAKECKNFSDNVMPLITQIKKFVQANKITFFEDAEINETKEGFSVNLSKVKHEEVLKFIEIEELLQNYINSIELFALYFVSRIADENIAFLTLGALYVEQAERVAKLLPITDGTADDCKAIWPLYISWKSRLQKMQLEKEKNSIDEKLKNINRVEAIKPIGTE